MRAAVTGMGVVTPAGTGVGEFLEALRETRQCLSELKGVPTPRGKSAVGLIHGSRFQGVDRAYRLALAASTEAVSQRAGEIGGTNTALIVSTIAADSEAAESRYSEFLKGEPFSDEVKQSLRLFSNGVIPERLGEHFGIWGARLVVSNACASGNVAMGIALDMIRQGRCRVVLVCGVELAKLTMVWGAERSGFLGRALRPFHTKRDGSVLGEGAGAVILEHPGDVEDRRVYGWLEGFGCGVDPGAAAITLLEDGSGLRRGMDLALRDAGVMRERVTYISAHAPGTASIDRMECKAVADLFGDHTANILINSTKSITTHLSAASAVVDAVAVLLQMQEGILHGNSGLDEPDPALQAPVAGPQSVARTTSYALSNACGGGAINTSVVLSAPQEPYKPVAPQFLPRRKRLWLTGTGNVSGYGASVRFERQGRQPSPRLDWFDVYDWFPRNSNYGYMNRAAQLGAVAGLLAVESAGIEHRYPRGEIAVLSGTFLGGTPESCETLCRTLHEEPNAMRPSMALDHGIHLAASLVRRHFGFYGLSYTVTGNGSAALMAIQVASGALLCNRAAGAVVVASDALDAALLRAASAINSGCLPSACLAEGAGAVTIEAGQDGQAELLGWTMLSTSWQWETAAEVAARIATSISACGWQRIYCAGSAIEEANAIAQCISGGREATTGNVMPGWYPMSAAPMFALATAVQSGSRALVISAERDGVIAAIGVHGRQ